MGFPFTPHDTFIPNSTPVIPADYLNLAQEADAAFAGAVAFGSQKLWAHSYDGATIKIETLHGALVKDYALGFYTAPTLPMVPALVTITNVVPTASLFNPSTWYYVYLRSNGRVAEFVISVTAPGSDLRWKGTDDTHRFLFSFRTTAARLIDPFVHLDGVTEYIGGEFDDRDEGVTVISSTIWTPITLHFCPPHVRRVELWVRLINSSTTQVEKLRILPKGVGAVAVSPGSAGKIVTCTTNTYDRQERVWVETDSTPAVEAKLALAAALNSGQVVVSAWREQR